jgi:hypothetical protein
MFNGGVEFGILVGKIYCRAMSLHVITYYQFAQSDYMSENTVLLLITMKEVLSNHTKWHSCQTLALLHRNAQPLLKTRPSIDRSQSNHPDRLLEQATHHSSHKG